MKDQIVEAARSFLDFDGRKFSRGIDNLMFVLYPLTNGVKSNLAEGLRGYVEQIDSATGLANLVLLARAYQELIKDDDSCIWLDIAHHGRNTKSIKSCEWPEIKLGEETKRVIGMELNLDSAITDRNIPQQVENEIIEATASIARAMVLGERKGEVFATQREFKQFLGEV